MHIDALKFKLCCFFSITSKKATGDIKVVLDSRHQSDEKSYCISTVLSLLYIYIFLLYPFLSIFLGCLNYKKVYGLSKICVQTVVLVVH